MSKKTFMENYKILEDCDNALSQMVEPDVDKIMPLVNSGMNAYKEVKSRIMAVRQSILDVEKEISKEA